MTTLVKCLKLGCLIFSYLMLWANMETGCFFCEVEFFLSLVMGQIFQSLMVSSAATLATVVLSGLVAIINTLLE